MTPSTPIAGNHQYKAWLKELKTRFKQQQIKAAVAVNKALLEYYWRLGREIAEKQKNATWGQGFLAQLSKDLMTEFPDIKGFSRRNLELIRQLYTYWESQTDITQQLVAQYVFDFLALTQQHNEHELERGLVQHITQFLLELGSGFAYMGQQVPLTVGDSEFYLDLLFYHTQLRCYVVIELKASKFKPEHAGKLNFYINAVDAHYKQDHDQPTVGLLLCKEKNKLVAEYALKGIESPIGVSEYQLTQALPDNLKSRLPSIEEIERELSGDLDSEGEDML